MPVCTLVKTSSFTIRSSKTRNPQHEQTKRDLREAETLLENAMELVTHLRAQLHDARTNIVKVDQIPPRAMQQPCMTPSFGFTNTAMMGNFNYNAMPTSIPNPGGASYNNMPIPENMTIPKYGFQMAQHQQAFTMPMQPTQLEAAGEEGDFIAAAQEQQCGQNLPLPENLFQFASDASEQGDEEVVQPRRTLKQTMAEDFRPGCYIAGEPWCDTDSSVETQGVRQSPVKRTPMKRTTRTPKSKRLWASPVMRIANMQFHKMRKAPSPLMMEAAVGSIKPSKLAEHRNERPNRRPIRGRRGDNRGRGRGRGRPYHSGRMGVRAGHR